MFFGELLLFIWSNRCWQLYITIRNAWGFQFLHTIVNLFSIILLILIDVVLFVLCCMSLISVFFFFSCAYWLYLHLFWGNVYSYPQLIFKIGLSLFCVYYFLYNLDATLIIDASLSFCGFSFTFLSMYFVEQYILFLMKFSSFFTLFAFVLGIIFKNILPNTSSQRLLPIFSSKSFTVLVITFRSSHFELILLFGVR